MLLLLCPLYASESPHQVSESLWNISRHNRLRVEVSPGKKEGLKSRLGDKAEADDAVLGMKRPFPDQATRICNARLHMTALLHNIKPRFRSSQVFGDAGVEGLRLFMFSYESYFDSVLVLIPFQY